MSDLVVVSLEGWDQVWRRNQHLIARMLRRDPELRVLFVEPSSDPLHTVARGAVPRLGHTEHEALGCDRLGRPGHESQIFHPRTLTACQTSQWTMTEPTSGCWNVLHRVGSADTS